MTIVISAVKFFLWYWCIVRPSQLREAVCSEVVRILREQREKKGLSMTRLAERAGLSQSMISLIEHDLRNPTLDTLLRIADVLEIELSDVLANAKRAVNRQSK